MVGMGFLSGSCTCIQACCKLHSGWLQPAVNIVLRAPHAAAAGKYACSFLLNRLWSQIKRRLLQGCGTAQLGCSSLGFKVQHAGQQQS